MDKQLKSYFDIGITPTLDKIMEAGMFIVEQEYVDQSPADTGNLRQEIRVKRNRLMDYVVESRATNRSEPYPLFLYFGTGAMRGRPDYGFTYGRVRDNDVAYGIGGIRPNKAADRTRAKATPIYLEFMKKELSKQL